MPKNIGNYVGLATGTNDSGVMSGVFNLFDHDRFRRTFQWAESIIVSGGTQITSGSYTYHVFISSGSLLVESGDITAEVLIVAGGGSGAGGQGGGGGGGGVVVGSSVPLGPGSYPVVVGSGGAAISPPVGYPSSGSNGSPSSFNSVTALCGGGGLRNNYAWPSYGGAPTPLAPSVANSGGGGGGSGPGGGSRPRTPQPVPANYTAYGGGAGAPQGTTGGASGGGGGGAGGNAPPASSTRPSGTPSPGGPGAAAPAFPAPVIEPAIPAPVRPTWTPAVGPTGVFGGGGGGGDDNTGGAGSGGPGGGGDGGNTDAIGTRGVEYTGGGGGATGANSNPYAPETAGGSGIVIVRY